MRNFKLDHVIKYLDIKRKDDTKGQNTYKCSDCDWSDVYMWRLEHYEYNIAVKIHVHYYKALP